MILKSALVRFLGFVVPLGLSGCGLFGNPTSGIGVEARNCKLDPNAPQGVPQCLPGTELMITPYVQVWVN
jgi:hypothetical protein